jgi:proteasome assembly chaperone 3
MPGQLARELDGQHTEVVIQNYADRTLVLVTQKGKVGNLIQVSIPPTAPLQPAPPPDPSNPNDRPLPPPPPSIELTPILGSAPSDHMRILHGLYASQIATIIWASESQNPLEVNRRSVVVGIALQKVDGDGVGLNDHQREVFLQVMNMVRDILAQNEG